MFDICSINTLLIQVRKQNESAKERLYLQASANDELRVLTNDVRTELIKNEVELRKAIHVEATKHEKRNSSNDALKKEIKKLERKYKEFQHTRKAEVCSVFEEITNLRQMMLSLQQQYIRGSTFGGGVSRSRSAYIQDCDVVESRLNTISTAHSRNLKASSTNLSYHTYHSEASNGSSSNANPNTTAKFHDQSELDAAVDAY